MLDEFLTTDLLVFATMRRFIDAVATSLLLVPGCVESDRADERADGYTAVTEDVSALHDSAKDHSYEAPLDSSSADADAGDSIRDIDLEHADGVSEADVARDMRDAMTDASAEGS